MGKSIIQLRPLSGQDIVLMERWLKTPHVAEWYTYPEHWLHEIRNREGDFSFLTQFIAEYNGISFGFCQYYDRFFAQKHEIWNKIWYTCERQGECYGIDYFIGDPEFLRRGFGTQMIKQLLKEIWQSGAKTVIVEPEKENTASNKALETAGFTQCDDKYVIKYQNNGKKGKMKI